MISTLGSLHSPIIKLAPGNALIAPCSFTIGLHFCLPPIIYIPSSPANGTVEVCATVAGSTARNLAVSITKHSTGKLTTVVLLHPASL